MLIVGVFQHTIELEEALLEIENLGIVRENILVIPMNACKIEKSEADGIEVGIACATALSVIGTSIGFILRWGPIIWGLLFAVSGFVLGFGAWFFFRKPKIQQSKVKADITVIVRCTQVNHNRIREYMITYGALSIGEIGP